MDKELKGIEELLSEDNIVVVKPEGYSMYPMFLPGRDEAVIRKAVTDRLKRGDVVLYRRKSGILVLHRIHHRNQDGFYMVGDNQIKVEGPLQEEQVKGVLEGFVRNGKYISTDNILYRAVSGLWLVMRPVRRPVQLIAAWVKKRLP